MTDRARITDHAHIRASHRCPLCNRDDKETGLLVCWDCYRAHDLRNGAPGTYLRDILDQAETTLRQAQQDAERIPTDALARMLGRRLGGIL